MIRAAKIHPPPVPAWSIARPLLEDLLGGALSRRLTTVVAGAGFGKSTLLARWSSGTNCAWYTVDPVDEALEVLVPGLLAALRSRLPDLPSESPASVSPGPGVRTEGRHRADALAADLCERLEVAIAGDLALVIDDAHELDPRGPATRLIEGLCRHAPASFHLIVASRVQIPFPIQRLRGRGEVLEIVAPMLAFTEEEVAEVLAVSPGVDGPNLAHSLHAMTGGWPAAVRLTIEALRGRGHEQAVTTLQRIRGPGGPLFAYLAVETFGGEPTEVRELLRRMAPFDRFTAELCAVLGVRRPEDTLADLLRRGLFVKPSSGPGGWYSLHTLVRDFAARTWPLNGRELRDQHRRAAKWFEAHGCLDDALRSLVRGSDSEASTRFLARRGAELLAGGGVNGVLELAGTLTPESQDPAVLELVGEAHAIRGEAALAEKCFLQAAGHAVELAPELAWRMGSLYHERGDYRRALEAYARGRTDGTRPREEALLLAAAASSRVVIGEVEAAQALAERALGAATASNDPRALAAAHATAMMLATGREPSVAEERYRLAHEWSVRAGDLIQLSRICTNRAAQLEYEGRYGEALDELDVAIRHAELAGHAGRLAHALHNRGIVRFRLGRMEEAIEDLERSRSLEESSGSGRAPPLIGLAAIHRVRGNLALARTMAEAALDLAQRFPDTQGRIGARIELALVLAFEDPERAWQLAEEALSRTRSWRGSWFALVEAGWVALATGRDDRARILAEEAAVEARRTRSRQGLAEATELQAICVADPKRRAAYLEEAIAIWRELGNPPRTARAELALARLSRDPLADAQAGSAEARLRAMGIRPAAAASAAGLLASLPQEDPPAVEIRTLGGFRVLCDGRPLGVRDWGSKKPRDLLKLLLARKGRPVPRDALMEGMWPDEDPEPLPRRLAVALSSLRFVLDPARRFPVGHFVAADDSAVWVDLDHVTVDFDRFLARSAMGLALLAKGEEVGARELLTAAESEYAGEFLEEDLYEDFATGLREEARATYISVARALSRMARSTGEHDAATRYLLRILQRDAYDEEAHLALVGTLEEAGQHGEARRWYRTYVLRMEELDVEPTSMPAARASGRGQ